MKNLHISIALLSLSLIAFQLQLMQIFSIVQWYHFAFMVISVALLGFGASGTVIALARDRLLKRVEFLSPLLMIACAATMVLAVNVSQLDNVRFDSYLVWVDGTQVRALVLTYLTLFVPFFFGALALGLVFVRFVDHIGSLYFANLLGSGLGGLIAVVLMWLLPAQQIPSLTALFPIVAGALILPSGHGKPLSLAVLLGLALSICSFLFPPRLAPSEYKNLSRTLHLPGARIVCERSSPHGLVQVVSSPVLRYAPGLSLSYQQPIPGREAVFSNGDWFGPIVSWSRNDSMHLLDYTTIGLPYAMARRERVLVLHAGTGMHVSEALTHGARRVVAVEPHSAALSVLLHDAVQATDSLFYQPAVTVRNVDARTFILTDTSRYDVIVLPTLDAFGGTAGLHALQEQYALTTEAFHEMWDHLEPDGVISLSSWMDYPIRNPLKALATLVQALSDAGVEKIAQHIAAVRSWGTITFVAKRTPLSQNEVQNVRAFCRQMLFDPALLPRCEPGERARYNVLADESFLEYLDEILSPARTALYDDYDFNIRPSTDDRPYFSQFLKWRSVPRLRQLLGQQTFSFLEIGYLIVAVTLAQIVLAAFVLILLPLFKGAARADTTSWTLLYFGALGVGYMFVEMIFIQRFVLYFGNPIYATAAVIGTMLISSGAGSYLSARVSLTSSVLWKTVILVAASIALYAIILTQLLHSTISLPIEAKAVLSFVIIAPPAVVMGMPFPLGLRFLSGRSDAQIAWAWGINGCMSVVSTALAMMLAVEAGFHVVMMCAAGAYAVAAAASYNRHG